MSKVAEEREEVVPTDYKSEEANYPFYGYGGELEEKDKKKKDKKGKKDKKDKKGKKGKMSKKEEKKYKKMMKKEKKLAKKGMEKCPGPQGCMRPPVFPPHPMFPPPPPPQPPFRGFRPMMPGRVGGGFISQYNNVRATSSIVSGIIAGKLATATSGTLSCRLSAFEKVHETAHNCIMKGAYGENWNNVEELITENVKLRSFAFDKYKELCPTFGHGFD